MSEAAERLLQISSGYIEAKILMAGAQLRVFDVLRGGGADAARVREALGASQRGVEILLDALTAMGVLIKDKGVYRAHPEYEPLLLEDSPTHFVGGLRHRNRCLRHWAFLEETITGRPLPAELRDDDTSSDADSNENFIRAMYAYSRDTAAGVVQHIDLAGVRTVADVGGGPGHYLAEFARRSPSLDLYLVDLPLTLKTAREIQRDSPESRRFHFVEWDVYNDPPPAGLPRLDLVFISQVIHQESPQANQQMFGRLMAVAAPGGRVVVHERVVNPDRTSPKEAALFAVNMLAMTENGRTYTEAEILDWAQAAGFAPESGIAVNERSYLVRFRRP